MPAKKTVRAKAAPRTKKAAPKRAKSAAKPARPARKTAATKAAGNKAVAKAKPKAAKAAKGATKPASKGKPKAAKVAAKKSAPKAAATISAPPQTGDEAVMSYMESVKPQQQDIVRALDHLIDTTVPGVQRAVKWNSAFYGVPGKGWMCTVAAFKEYVSIGFFAGSHMNPKPPEGDKGTMRRYKLRSMSDLDEHQMRSWLQQASQMQGWGSV